MMQVENEYGSYGEIRLVRDLMIERGVTRPLLPQMALGEQSLEVGTLIDEHLLVGNFGSRADENFASMKEFFPRA